MGYELLSNFALEGFVLVAWLLAKQLLARSRRVTRALLLGALVGLGTIAVMAAAVEMDGVLFDMRFALIASVTLLEGPLAGVITALLAAAYRIWVGGAGAVPGMIAIVAALGVALIGYYLRPKRRPQKARLGHIFAFATASATLPFLSIFLLPAEVRSQLERAIVSSDIALNWLAILMFWFVVRFFDAKARENAMLVEALAQSPDYLYIKTDASRFVAANNKVLAHHGCASSADIRGKTDLDIEPDKLRARELLQEEQRLFEDSRHFMTKREVMPAPDGSTRVFDTIKTKVRDLDGHTIGLVGITRDITEETRAHHELEDSQKLLSLILSTMSDGVGLFDADGRLIFCNEQYHRFFSLTRDVRVPGAKLDAILSAAAERGEQLDIPQDDVAGWVAQVVAGLKRGGKQEVRLFDGRTIEIRTRLVENGSAVSVVSDISQIRAAEQELAALAAQLQVLATTDPLTAVMNRRAFDDQLNREFDQARRSGQPLSLLILDVDRFKAFNDQYGHPEGDQCLKKVASTLAASLTRSTDAVARYGGEEFCVLLPSTDAEGAMAIAEMMRAAIEERNIAHTSSKWGRVTVSIGVDTFKPGAPIPSPLILKERADKALYEAKAKSRNTVCAFTGEEPARTFAAS